MKPSPRCFRRPPPYGRGAEVAHGQSNRRALQGRRRLVSSSAQSHTPDRAPTGAAHVADPRPEARDGGLASLAGSALRFLEALRRVFGWGDRTSSWIVGAARAAGLRRPASVRSRCTSTTIDGAMVVAIRAAVRDSQPEGTRWTSLRRDLPVMRRTNRENLRQPDVSGRFVQDCEVCCNPWLVRVTEEDGDRSVEIGRTDGSD